MPKKPTVPTKPKSATLLPIADRVQITPPPKLGESGTDQKVGALYLPDTAQTGKVLKPYFAATVLAAGDECKTVKVGDWVIVDRMSIFHVEVLEENLDVIMIREPSIISILK